MTRGGGDVASGFYWCLTHGRVEEGQVCKATNRMGPYETPEAARRWRERHEQRSDSWEEDDERWEGEGGSGPDDARRGGG
jgi:hypothetical protein